jgi:NAD(P)-dependent dehydrogenase (short-subunit alcohol dehydrogenase family)
VFSCLKYEIPLMLKPGGGAIVNTSSGAGVKGFGGGVAHAASKFGMVGLSKSAALGYEASNIWIHAICPGDYRHRDDAALQRRHPEGREAVIARGRTRLEPQGQVVDRSAQLSLPSELGLIHQPPPTSLTPGNPCRPT